jgi:hypothetical protein
MANLERCLAPVANQIGRWMIGGAGSTAGTPGLIRAWFAKRGLPGELFSLPGGNLDQVLERACPRPGSPLPAGAE